MGAADHDLRDRLLCSMHLINYTIDHYYPCPIPAPGLWPVYQTADIAVGDYIPVQAEHRPDKTVYFPAPGIPDRKDHFYNPFYLHTAAVYQRSSPAYRQLSAGMGLLPTPEPVTPVAQQTPP